MTRPSYSKLQSLAVALWVIALQDKRTVEEGKCEHKTDAPPLITELVNALGEPHSPSSIFFHTMGYEVLFYDRVIDRRPTALQKQIAGELVEQELFIKRIN